MVRNARNRSRQWMQAALCATALAACGGGGGGDGEAHPPPPSPPTIAYGLDAPSQALGQPALALTLSPATTVLANALKGDRVLAAPTAETFVLASGPDAAGDALPRISGDYDRLTQSYTQGLASKLWIDLPASADAHPVALEVTRVLQASAMATSPPQSGEILVTRRPPSAEFSGRLRLSFHAGPTPVCLGWDAAGDGSYEVERCLSASALRALWAAPDAGLGLPVTVQRAAGATWAAWSRFTAQFEFAVAALRIAAAQHDALAAAPATAVAATIACSVYPPSGQAGHYSVRWLDRNGTGRFDSGDDVRLEASGCWQRLTEGDSGPGRLLDGALELRAYERDVGAAPTYLGFTVIDTEDVAGIVTPQGSAVLHGGYSARLPGLLAANEPVQAYRFDAGNLLAAGGVAARSMSFYADIGDFAFRGLQALVGGATGTQALDLCGNSGNGGASTVTLTEGPAPNNAGLSAGDTVRVVLVRCDRGRGGSPRLHEGSVVLSIAGVATGPGTDWTAQADVQVDLETVSAEGSQRRLGQFGLQSSYVLGHSYSNAFRPQGYATGRTVSGVLTGLRNGEPDYQIGCFDASTFRGTWDWSDQQLKPNQVVKSAGRVFTIGMRQGESFLFKADALGRYLPDVAQAGLSPISAPECLALGVPANGVSGGDNTMIFDAWPAGDGGRVRLQLNGPGGGLLGERWVDWLALVR